FCQSLCWYCGCNSNVTSRRERISEYLALLCKEILLKRKIISCSRKTAQIHWGGGSPSYMKMDEIVEMSDLINSQFPRDKDCEVSMEIDPRDLQGYDLDKLKACGFNRISIGVQDFNTQVLEAVNRNQHEGQVVNIYNAAREAGFLSVNLDLIYGLPRQTVDTFSKTIEKVLSLDPDRIALFNFAYLPDLKPHQRLIKKDQLADSGTRLKIFKSAVEMLTGGGYKYIGMDHFAKPGDELSIAQQNNTLTRNFQGYSTKSGSDVFAFGITGISQINGVYAQNHKEFDSYSEAVDREEIPVFRGYILNTDDEIRRHVITRLMCDMRLDFEEVGNKFSVKFSEYFAESLEKLREPINDGLLSIKSENIVIEPEGRFFIRNIAMAFDRFLKENFQLFSQTV
ncbi:MAG: oxygen-independent coproporphyrinogen III oxidase, partial [bacterium]